MEASCKALLTELNCDTVDELRKTVGHERAEANASQLMVNRLNGQLAAARANMAKLQEEHEAEKSATVEMQVCLPAHITVTLMSSAKNARCFADVPLVGAGRKTGA